MIDQSKAIILNDEPVSFKEEIETASTFRLTFIKGNCNVDVFNHLMRGDCDKVKTEYKDFKYKFIPIFIFRNEYRIKNRPYPAQGRYVQRRYHTSMR